MKFSIDVADTEVAQLLLDLVKINGIETWQRRFEWLQRELTDNPFMEHWLRERCSLEWTMNGILADPSLKVGHPFRVTTLAQYELIGFAAGIVRCYDHLSERAQKRLRGILSDGLKEDKGLLSIQHEITTAVHLMSRGFDVEFRDLESGGGFDFLAKREDVELEVECKMFSADIGRKIHHRRAATFFKALATVVSETYSSATTGLIIDVTIPDRLTPASAQHLAIEQTVRTALISGEAITRNEHCAVKVRDFSIGSSPFGKHPANIPREEIDQFVANCTGRLNHHLMILFSPGKRAVILSVASEKKDEVLHAMHRQLREAAKGQFTKTRPAILAIQLHDLTADQLADLALSDSSTREQATGLQIMTSDFLQSPSRAHIHSVVFRSHGKLEVNPQAGTKQASGLTYVIKNGYHPLHDDLHYSVFGIRSY
ncbi:MAG TPA: hypothetical protein VEC35_15090 [Noviherbaspirillum sp.]|nr:hypothetical protein [Noviherbaspirillum sp.]